MERTSTSVWIGTAGYAWPEWIGPFYPPGSSAEQMASHYASHFPCVEISSTFFRCPTPGQLESLADQTAPGFHYSLKVPRTVTYEQRIRDLAPFVKSLDELARSHRLIGVVAQFPDHFHDTPANRHWVERVVKEIYPFSIWVEFRSASWFRPKLGEWLHQRGASLAAIDVPDQPGLFPGGIIDRCSDRLYVRMYSRNKASFLGPIRTRCDFNYSDAILMEWLGKLRQAAPSVREAFVIFNNCHGIEAVLNGQRLAELIAETAPEFHAVAPPGPPLPRQQLLFV